MKGNIKKLVVFVSMAAIAMLVTAMASADDHAGKKAIRGKYASTGSGSTFLAPLGFTNLIPNGPPGAYIFQAFSGEGVYIFERDGTGSFEGINHIGTLSFVSPNPTPPPPTITNPSSAGAQHVSFLFHYTMTDDGKITITADPGTQNNEWISGPSTGKIYHLDGLSRTGFITPDHKTITLTGGAPSVLSFIAPFGDLPPTAQLINNASSVLIWQHD